MVYRGSTIHCKFSVPQSCPVNVPLMATVSYGLPDYRRLKCKLSRFCFISPVALRWRGTMGDGAPRTYKGRVELAFGLEVEQAVALLLWAVVVGVLRIAQLDTYFVVFTMASIQPTPYELAPLWRGYVAAGELLVTAAAFLCGFCFTALFVIHDAADFQVVRVFFLVAAVSTALAVAIGNSALVVTRRLELLVLSDPEDTDHRVVMRRYLLLRMSATGIMLGQAVFLFALLMVLGGLLRYSIQAYTEAGTVVGIVATSISIIGVFSVTLLGCLGWLVSS